MHYCSCLRSDSYFFSFRFLLKMEGQQMLTLELSIDVFENRKGKTIAELVKLNYYTVYIPLQVLIVFVDFIIARNRGTLEQGNFTITHQPGTGNNGTGYFNILNLTNRGQYISLSITETVLVQDYLNNNWEY